MLPVKSDALWRIADALDRIDSKLGRLIEEQAKPAPAARRQRPRRNDSGMKVDDPRVMARNFIRTQLQINGPMSWADLAEAGRAWGHSPRTMRDERKKVAAVKVVEGRWLWQLRPGDGNGER